MKTLMTALAVGVSVLSSCAAERLDARVPSTHPAEVQSATPAVARPTDLQGTEHAVSSADQPPPRDRPASATYTCPMHPEVRSPAPGRCPKCGMDLQKVEPTP